MNPTIVRVTAQHIADGTACEGTRCPIALALFEALADQGVYADSVMVGEDHVSVIAGDKGNWDSWRRLRAALDEHGRRFVEAFDTVEEHRIDRDKDAIAPFEMVLTWVEVP